MGDASNPPRIAALHTNAEDALTETEEQAVTAAIALLREQTRQARVGDRPKGPRMVPGCSCFSRQT